MELIILSDFKLMISSARTIKGRPYTAKIKGDYVFGTSSGSVDIELSGVTEVKVISGGHWIPQHALEALGDDFKEIFNTNRQPYTKEQISEGKKKVDQICYDFDSENKVTNRYLFKGIEKVILD